MIVTDILAWVLIALLAVPSIVFVVECLSGFSGQPDEDAGTAPPFAVLVPAHDEARGIAGTIAAIQAQLRPCDRLLVVADNCSDDTLAVTLSCDARAVVRHDPSRRGKGFALAAGRDALQLEPPAVVIVVDADCRPERGALQRLAATAAKNGAVVQALYLLETDPNANARSGISTFAFLVKNKIRQRGLARLGAPALLQGTGMAFPWRVFADAPLASDEIVEDLELGLKLALSGSAIRFFEPAVFVSRASSGSALVSQRTRWEHGSIGMARRYVPVLAKAILRGRFELLALLLDLFVPPLALLVLAATAATILVTAYGVYRSDLALSLAAPTIPVVLGIVVTAMWSRFGRASLPFGALMRVPAYMWWKIPIYLRLIAAPERRWIRTGRDE